MDIADIERRKQELAKQVEEAQRLLAAYAVVEADLLAGGSGNPQPVQPSVSQPQVSSAPRRDRFAAEDAPKATSGTPPGFSAAVRAALKFMPAKFTLNEVEARLKELGIEVPRINISFVLSRFQKAGVITMLEKGVGKKSGVYCLPGALQAQPASAQT